jgi:Flp pilus assembly CpaE family ATPase
VIFFVVPLNVPAVRQARRFFDLLAHEGLVNLPVKIVANRVVGKRPMGDHISMAQIEKALGRRIDFFIPEDNDLLAGSLNQGRPAALLNRKSKYVQAVSEMLMESCGVDFRAGGGVFKKLFGGGNVEKESD